MNGWLKAACARVLPQVGDDPRGRETLREHGLVAVTYAKRQRQYLPLAAVMGRDGLVTTRWELTWRQRWQAFWRGNVWLQQVTFGAPLQPVRVTVVEPQLSDCHYQEAEA